MNNRKILLFLSLGFLISCSSTNEELEKDWVVDIQSEIKAYDIKAKMIDEAKHSDSESISKMEVYSESESGLYKLRTIDEVVDTYVFESVIYSKNDKIVYVIEKGVVPFIYKKTKQEDEPCCSIFERQIYFNSNGIYKAFKKEIKILETSDLEFKSEGLELMTFQEDSIFNINSKYDELKTILKSGIEYLKKN